MTTPSQIWEWKISSKPLHFKSFKLWVFGLAGREVAPSYAGGMFDMCPRRLYVFDNDCREFHLVPSKHPLFPLKFYDGPLPNAQYHVPFEWLDAQSGGLPPTLGGMSIWEDSGEGWSAHHGPGALCSCSDLFHPTMLLVGGASLFYGLGQTLFVNKDHIFSLLPPSLLKLLKPCLVQK